LPPAVTIDRRERAPVYRQICDGYRDAIVAGRLRPGERVPSTRGLAEELGISRIPVLTAFEQLLAEGYFEARVGSGTFVARSLPEETLRAAPPASAGRRSPRRLAPRPPIRAAAAEPWLRGFGAFRVSQPAVEQFPFKVWASLFSRHCRNPRAALLHYGEPMGHLPLRQAVAAHLATARAVRCDAEQVMIVSGSQQALAIAARVLHGPGDEVFVEDPGYRGARDVLRMVGARLRAVPVDAEGFDVAAAVARGGRARAAYVTPSHQYPLGVTMSASRRLQLLDWAARTGAWIVEDDYDSEYRYESLPVAALQGLDADGRVVYIGTFSKVLFPALRLGYVVVPRDLVRDFVAVREAMDVFPPRLPQAMLADFIAEGHFARHVRRVRGIYRERRAALVAALGHALGTHVEVVGDAAGMHLVAALKRGHADGPVALRAAAEGLWTMPLSSCYLGRPARQGLVLGFGGATVAEIRAGTARLRRLLFGRSGLVPLIPRRRGFHASARD
jgi:GntR family transcriptional regulator/MocR family aminotransferase